MYPEFYFVGDLIDRGPGSKLILDFIFELKKEGVPVSVVRGNHEEMLLYSYKKNFSIKQTNWFYNGADKTILSFNKDADLTQKVKTLIPFKYFKFINSFPYFIELNDFFIVHAGFNFNIKNLFSDVEYMLWAREEHYSPVFIKGKKIKTGE